MLNLYTTSFDDLKAPCWALKWKCKVWVANACIRIFYTCKQNEVEYPLLSLLPINASYSYSTVYIFSAVPCYSRRSPPTPPWHLLGESLGTALWLDNILNLSIFILSLFQQRLVNIVYLTVSHVQVDRESVSRPFNEPSLNTLFSHAWVALRAHVSQILHDRQATSTVTLPLPCMCHGIPLLFGV